MSQENHLLEETRSPEERLVVLTLRCTFLLYLMGALYVVGPALGWCLGAIAIGRWLLERRPHGPSAPIRIPPTTLLWLAAMAVMLIALLLAHAEQGFGVAKTVKSTIGWTKGWALLALFPLAGCARIRPTVLYRGACEIGLQALVLLPLCIAAAHSGLPEILWVSPTRVVGGPGPEFFAVRLYSVDPAGGFRYWLFAPWAPALGFIANLYLVLALRERNLWWRLAGVAGAAAMILASGSRLGLVAAVVVHSTTWAVTGLFRPWKWIGGGSAALASAFFAQPLAEIGTAFAQRFHASRLASSRVRAALGRIAVERWRDEAPLLGHGVVEPGPHLVEFMPIGSHHTWYGLLFVKGALGFISLAAAMTASFVSLWIKAQECRHARAAFAILLALFMYSLGENIEILAYLLWPGLISLGIGHRMRWPAALRSIVREGVARRLSGVANAV